MEKKYRIYQAMKDILIDSEEEDFYDVDMYIRDICTEIFFDGEDDKYGIKHDLASYKQALVLLVRDDMIFDKFNLLDIDILFEKLVEASQCYIDFDDEENYEEG